jgi:hypothetical protein
MSTRLNTAKSSGIGAQSSGTPLPTFLKFFLPVTFTGAFLSAIVSAAIYKANRALSIGLMALSALAVGVGSGLHKRRRWAIPATHVLFAFSTLFALLQLLFLGAGGNGNDPQAFVNVPVNTWGWIVWSVVNVQSIAPSVTPIILSLFLGVWVPSYISLRGKRMRAHFGLAALEVTGKPLVICISLCCLLPIYGLAIPVTLYNQSDLLDTVPSLQLFCSVDAWVTLMLTIYGIRTGVELWSCHHGALRRVRKLLTIRFIYSVCFGALLFILTPNAAADYLLFGGGRYSFLTGIASGVLLILLKSWNFQG